MLRTSAGAEGVGEAQERLEVPGSMPFVPSSIDEAEVARGGGGIRDLGSAHQQQRRVVADLEQADVLRAGRLEARRSATAARRPGRSAARRRRRCRGRSCFDLLEPVEPVEPLEPLEPFALDRQHRGLVEHGLQRDGIVREAPEEEPVDGVAEGGQQPGAGGSAVDDEVPGRSATASRSARVTVRMWSTGAGSGAPIAQTGSYATISGPAGAPSSASHQLRHRARGGHGRLVALGLADAQHRPESVAEGGVRSSPAPPRRCRRRGGGARRARSRRPRRPPRRARPR